MAFVKFLRPTKKIPISFNSVLGHSYSKFTNLDLKKCYAILGVDEDSDQEKIRSAYLDLVKKYHPDRWTPTADAIKFQEIDNAFKIILSKKSKERWTTETVNFGMYSQKVEEFDIKHTAPQHRQYLNFDGQGIGTPSQREKQYEKMRAIKATENVLNHRINKALADDKSLIDKQPQQHKIKTRQGYERLVEDLIQEAMSKGEFDNLPGRGKPLKEKNTNPYVDFVTHKLNQILIESGFTPEWITLQKEIRQEKSLILQKIETDRNHVGKYPFQGIDKRKWNMILESYKDQVDKINKKIEKYNLLVPILRKQMFKFNLEKDAEKIAKLGQSKSDGNSEEMLQNIKIEKASKSLLTFLENFIVKK